MRPTVRLACIFGAAAVLASCAVFEELYGNPASAVINVANIPDIEVPLPLRIALDGPAGELWTDAEPGTRLSLPEISVEHDLRAQVAQYVSVDRIDRIDAVGLHRRCDANTLNVTLDAMTVRVGGIGDGWLDALDAARIGQLLPRNIGETEGTIIDGNRAAVSERLTSLQISLGVQPEVIVGQNPPDGRAECRLVLSLRVTPRL